MNITRLFFASFMMIAATINAEPISSPNKKINVEIKNNIDGYNTGIKISYNNKLLPTYVKIGLDTENSSFLDSLTVTPTGKSKLIKEEYEMITGKRSLCKNSATEQILEIKNNKNQSINLIIRVYNDGIAFRYAAKGQNSINKEHTTFHIPEGQTRWMQTYAPDSYERFFPKSTSGTNSETHKWGFPSLIENPDSVFVLITESEITRGNCAAYLSNEKKAEEFTITYPDNKLEYHGEWTSPWRMMIIGKLQDIVESTLVTDVASPSKLKKTNWIYLDLKI